MKTISLKNLPEATEQEVFDQVVSHLLAQNKKSTDGVTCLYFDKETGFKCAAGCLISEDEYRSEMENEPWDKLIEEGKVPTDHRHLIASLQSIHDYFEPIHWENRLKEVAKKYDLNFNP